MHLDVLDLRQFYYRTRLGRVAQKAVRDQVLRLWPVDRMKTQTLAGFGFAVPLLRPYLADARRVLALMPGQQGVMPWPAGLDNVSVLCSETVWPLQPGQVDRLVVLHGLETSEHPRALLAECDRVLAPGGKALFIVPNRSGLWARSDRTPFGFGRPYLLSQLEAQVKAAGFVPERHVSALFAPPSEAKFWRKAGPTLERLGRRMPDLRAGGAILLEVSKQVYAPTRPGLAERVRRPLRVLEPAMPEAKPVGRS